MAISKATGKSVAVAAKGDLVVGSATNDALVLGVGNNGETLVADSSATTGLRYNPPVGSLANPAINAAFDIWQRGTSLSGATNNTYTADRWSAGGGGNATTVSRQTTGDTTNLPNIQYCARVQRDSGNTSTYARILTQAVETTNAIPFAGKAVTFSFYARKGANFSGASDAFVARVVTGTGTDQNTWSGYTNQANTISGTVTLTTTWQRFVVTGTIPTNCTEFTFYFDYTPVGTAGASDYYEVTGVQLDVGTWTASTAPTFRRSGGTLAGELAACQRYYYRSAISGVLFTGHAYSTTSAYVQNYLPITMRTSPTTSLGASTSFTIYSGGASFTPTSANAHLANASVVSYEFVTSGMTAGRGAWLQGNGSTTYLEASAEL